MTLTSHASLPDNKTSNINTIKDYNAEKDYFDGLNDDDKNIFLAMEQELSKYDPSLASVLREKVTPALTKQLLDIEKSAKALEISLQEVEQSYMHQKKMVDTAHDQDAHDKITVRLSKLEAMIGNTKRSLELNRSTRDDIIQWLIGAPLPKTSIK